VQIVGIDHSGNGQLAVHTIDIWYSARSRAWLVERLDEDGHLIGAPHRCESEDEARACLEEWMRTHGETHLVSPPLPTAAERRVAAPLQRRRAA
jgi:hypothetical protein